MVTKGERGAYIRNLALTDTTIYKIGEQQGPTV